MNEELVRVCVDSYMFQQRPNPKGLTVTLGFQFHQVQHLRFRNFETCTKKNHPKKSSKSKQQKKDRIQVFKDFFFKSKSLLSFKIITMSCARINFLYLFFSLLRFLIWPNKTTRHGKVMRNPISIQAARAPWSDAHRCLLASIRWWVKHGGWAFV